MQILCRRTKNNPVLIGEAGVGKTAIAEGLAQKIADGEVPEVLANRRVVTMELGGIVAGTIYRGQFEERMEMILNEIRAAKNIVLFVDEVQRLIENPLSEKILAGRFKEGDAIQASRENGNIVFKK